MKSSLNLNISKYPCKYCIIKIQCVTICDRVIQNVDLIDVFFKDHVCPYCGSPTFYIFYEGNEHLIIECIDCCVELIGVKPISTPFTRKPASLTRGPTKNYTNSDRYPGSIIYEKFCD